MIGRAWIVNTTARAEQQQREIEALRQQIAELIKRIEQLEAKRGPGRPPKQ